MSAPPRLRRTRTTLALLAVLAATTLAHAAGTAARVHKASVGVHGAPDVASPRVATLKRDTPVQVAAQQGLWYQLALDGGSSGYVRVNDVRLAHAATEGGDADVRALLHGSAGKGRVTETASVRGIDESALRAATYDAGGMAALATYRVQPADAAAHAAANGWQAREVAFPAEAMAARARGTATQAEKRGGLAAARSLLSRVGGSALGEPLLRVADRAAGKSEQELAAEELALGPEIAGRVLGAAPLWADAGAQRRVNLIGQWVASRTARPDLPWTFGVLDDGEINAFAAPGGYVLITRGLYQLLGDDAEVAAVIAHELGHVVQRDHYEVIRRQQVAETGKDIALAEVRTGGNLAASYARDYVDRHGAMVMLGGLDREAEYRADASATVYLRRAGIDPLALYSVLQKMTVLGTRSARLAQLYRTHPPLDQRLERLDRQ
jgi:beta-barrel assembly-enhancing protease